MAAKAIFNLIDRGSQRCYSIDGVHAGDGILRRPNCRRHGEGTQRIRGVRVMTVHARGVAVVLKHGRLRRIVSIRARGQEMRNLGEFGIDIGSRG